jgi:DNA-binding CsgD family transcriptional regulator
VTPSKPLDDPHRAARDAAAMRFAEEACRYLQVDSPPTKLAALLQDFEGSFIVKDSGGRVVLASPTFTKQFSDAAEPNELAETALIPEEVRAMISRADNLVLKHGRMVSFCFELTGHLKGKFATQRFPMTTSTRGIVGLVGVVQEVRPGLPAGFEWSDKLINLDQLRVLDEREVELAQLLSHGAINKQLAKHFGVSIRSVENWRRGLLNKLGVETIPELTRWVVRLEDFGLLPIK